MTRVRSCILNVGAVLGALCVLATLAAVVFDVRPLVVRSGSMAPALDAGALALAHRVAGADLVTGDVVTVTSTSGSRVTHRIVELTRDGGITALRLRGDANADADKHLYEVTEADLVIASVPRAGYAVGWLTGPFGRVAVGLYAGFLVMVLVRPGRQALRETGPGRRRATGRRSVGRTATVTVTVVMLGALGLARPTPGWAAWGDAVTVAGTALSTHLVRPPDSVVCTGGGLLTGLTYSWPNRDPRYTYRVDLVNSAGSVHRTSSVPGTGGTHSSITYSAADLPNGDFTVKVRSALTSSPAWTSSTSRDSAGNKLNVSVLGITTACA